MVTEAIVIPKSIYRFVRKITGQSNFHIALLPATKNTVQSLIEETQVLIAGFENKYKMTFPEFEKACDDGRIKDPFSYEVEKDDWEWEAAIGELELFDEILQWLISVEENIKQIYDVGKQEIK